MSLFRYIKNLLTGNEDFTKKGCPACDSPNVICTNFSSFNDDYSGPLINLYKLKTGQLLQCEICKAIWFIDNSKEQADTVVQDRLRVVKEWNSKKLSIRPNHLQVLLEIGCTPSDHYGNLKEFISIPCKCTLTSGEIIENAVVSIQGKPPVGLIYHGHNDFYFIDQVIEIQPSDLSLPLKVRIETAKADEIRMGWAPTVVFLPNNKMYITNGTTNFFLEDGVKGKDISISADHQGQFQAASHTENLIKEIRIIADWTLELEKLFNLNEFKNSRW